MAEIRELDSRRKVVEIDGDLRAIQEVYESLGFSGEEKSLAVDNKKSLGTSANSVRSLFDAVYSIYESEDWAYIAVNSLAKLVRMALPRVYSYDENAKEGEQKTEIPNHPLQKLFEKPNKYQTSASFLYVYAINYYLHGNAIFWYAPKSKGLWVIPTDNITPQVSTNGLEGYWLAGLDGITKAAQFKVDEVVHMRLEDPRCIYWGLSPFIPARKSLEFNSYAMDFLNSFFKKGATFPVIFERTTGASEEKIVSFLRQFEAAYTGVKNQRRGLALPLGMTAKVVEHKISDNQTLEAIKLNRDTILNILGVPKHAVSLQEAGSLGSEEHKMAIRFMWINSVKPFLTELAENLTVFFRVQKLLADNEYFEFDNSEIESITNDLLSRATSAKELMLAGLTVNEVRAKVWELEPLPDGDVTPAIPAKPAPAFGVPSTPTGQNDDTEDDEDTEDEPEETTEPTQEEARAQRNRERLSKFKVDIVELAKKPLAKVKEVEAQAYGETVKLSMGLFEKQAEIAMKLFVDMAKDLNLDYETKDDSAKISRAQYLKNLKREFAKLQPKWNEEYTSALFPTVEMGIDAQIEAAFFLEDKNTIKVITEANMDETNDLLKARGIDSFKTITTTSAQDIFKVITEGLEQQKTIKEISAAIAEKAGTWPDYRSERIARTEVLTAMSVGQSATNDAIVEAFPDLKLFKVWITGDDDRVRDTHAEMHLMPVPVDEDFQLSDGDSLAYPRDAKGQPENTINCRCSHILLTEEELAEL
jgi:HK97 family phage portal protein